MSDARLAHGTKIKMGDGADPEVFTDIGEVGDFDYPQSTELVEVTNHQSGGFKEYIADVADGEEISFPVNYSDSDATHNTATGLRGKLGQQVNFRIEAPGETDGTEIKTIVTGVSRSFPVAGGQLSMTVTIKQTGAPSTYTIS